MYKGVVESGTAEALVPWEEVQCPQCEMWFGSEGALRSHAVRTHGRTDQLRRFCAFSGVPSVFEGFFRPEHVRFTMHDTLRGVVSSGF